MNRFRRGSVLAWLCVFSAASAQGPIVLRDVTRQTGITFRHTDGSRGDRCIVESVTAGVAVFDYDGDGDGDIYFLNGAPPPGARVDPPPRNALYRNDGGWKFTDVTEQAGVGDRGFALGVAAADYDNDGDVDLYVNNFGPNVLYRNNGDGTFTDATAAAGVGNGNKVGAGTCFLDIDGDGHLDLYVSSYLEFSYQTHVPTTIKGFPAYANPRRYPAAPDNLYRNNGDGTFTDVSEQSGIAAYAGWGMGMVCGDYDNDGDTDIFVGNDVSENFLFDNDGTGEFEEVALIAGAAYDLIGQEHATMGVDCGDFNNDGWLDFHATSYQEQFATLYKNLGDGAFEDVTRLTGAGTGTLPYVTWGNALADLDNDGDRDLFIACGHIHDNLELFDDRSSYLAKNQVLMNTGDEKFVNVSDTCGDGLTVKLSSRGVGLEDLDDDGDLDVVVLNSRREPTILRNDSPAGNHWLQVRLRGIKSNRNGVGAHVKVVAGDLVQMDEVHSGRGYQSHYGLRLHFGLGKRNRVDRVEVRWIGGGVDVLENPGIDRVVTITEGSGRTPPLSP
ncbi:MAG: CRTAC1 family protein [Pirellulales bacterium]|nr:CRTAC1 family protein [Pirellulales bacterium]